MLDLIFVVATLALFGLVALIGRAVDAPSRTTAAPRGLGGEGESR